MDQFAKFKHANISNFTVQLKVRSQLGACEKVASELGSGGGWGGGWDALMV